MQKIEIIGAALQQDLIISKNFGDALQQLQHRLLPPGPHIGNLKFIKLCVLNLEIHNFTIY